MLLRPSIYFDYSAGSLDPRQSFTRASAATYCDRNGIIRTRSAGNPRFGYQPSNGQPLGWQIGSQSTNYLLWSEDFTNAVWTKTSASVTAAMATAPDGNNTGSQIMATGAGGSVSQAFTITANDLIQYSLFARKSASQFVSLTLSNGVNPCAVWFDLNQGVVGGNTPGGGSCVFSGAAIEAWPGGWFRCTMSVSTNASTNFTAAFQPASANNASTATNDAVMAWGASLSHGVTGAFYGRTPAYIQTAAAQGSRANEISQFILPDANFDPNQGTFFVHYTVPVASGQAGWTGGSGNTINDYISLRHSVRLDGGASNIFGTIVAGGVQVALAQDTTSGIGFETPIRAAFAYKQGDVAAFCVNGRPVVQSSIPAAWPAAPARIVVGGQPFNQNVLAEIAIRRFAYFPRKLTNAQLIKLTT